MSEGWQRVTREHPCGICEKPDWCCKGERGWACMRIESDIVLKNSGWFHPFNRKGGDASCQRSVTGRPVCVRRVDSGAGQSNPALAPNFTAVLSDWIASGNGEVGRLAFDLGVSERALKALGTAWAPQYRAFAFPMTDGSGKIVGIRLRGADGKKWAVTGSKQGLFLPMPATSWLSSSTVMITEGPTDTAAALTLGLFAIGRPQCLGCEDMVASVLRQLGCRDVIVCFDNDSPGVRGAQKLASALQGIRVTRFVPPTKDLRNFLHLGGSMELLLSMTNNSIRSRA